MIPGEESRSALPNHCPRGEDLGAHPSCGAYSILDYRCRLLDSETRVEFRVNDDRRRGLDLPESTGTISLVFTSAESDGKYLQYLKRYMHTAQCIYRPGRRHSACLVESPPTR